MKRSGAFAPIRRAIPDAGPVLGIECGATHSHACLVDEANRVLGELRLGPANLRLMSDAQLNRHLRAIQRAFPKPRAVALGMAGARTAADRARLAACLRRLWPRVPSHATNDLETALAAAPSGKGDAKSSGRTPRVLVLSGTGSCVYGRRSDGVTSKIGGWGHRLGDKGSGFDIGLRALKAAVYYLDRDGEWSRLGASILTSLQLNEPEDLIDWAGRAPKHEMAALARIVFDAAAKGDGIARDVLEGAAASLAEDAVACAGRLARRGSAVEFVLAGSVLRYQRRFSLKIGRLIQSAWPRSRVTVLEADSVWGAVALARRVAVEAAGGGESGGAGGIGDAAAAWVAEEEPGALGESPTERRHPKSGGLDRMSLEGAIELMLREESGVAGAIRRERAALRRLIERTARALRGGGRLIYVGAGTSGRLGVLDASECPPTFRTDPEMVQGVIAGGRRALWRAVEGAEDDANAGARAVSFRRVTRRDVVVGIAASGRTPFVRGALVEAKRRRATTALLTFNPRYGWPRAERPDVVICPEIGPEVLTGSTRLKAGTATKLVLNILSTLTMVKLGKVKGNLMVDVQATNVKLRDRAARMVQDLAGCDYATARAALKASRWHVASVCARLRVKRKPK